METLELITNIVSLLFIAAITLAIVIRLLVILARKTRRRKEWREETNEENFNFRMETAENFEKINKKLNKIAAKKPNAKINEDDDLARQHLMSARATLFPDKSIAEVNDLIEKIIPK